MNNFRHANIALCVTLLAVLVPLLVRAEVVTADFSGTLLVTQDDNGFFAAAGAVNGDVVEGTFTYDAASPPFSEGTGISQYWPANYSFTIGGNKITYNWPTGCCGSGITIRDNFSSIGDMFMVSFSGDLVDVATGATESIYSTNSWIADNTGSSWSGTALPGLALMQQFVNSATNVGYQSFSRMQGNAVDFRLQNFSVTVRSGEQTYANSAGPSDAIEIVGSEPAVGGGVNKIVGWQFQVDEEVTIGAIGYRDRTCTADAPICDEGFVQDHEVAVWDSTQTLVTSALIPNGTAAERIGDFRYIPVSPVTLQVGETYTVAGFNPEPDDDGTSFCANGLLGDLAFDGRITFLSGVYKPFVSSFGYPSGFSSYGKPCLGPNLRFNAEPIPYPHAYYPLNGSGLEVSGNNIDLLPVGSPAYSASLDLGLGDSIALNGVDNALVGSGYIPSSTGQVSLAAWAYADSAAQWGSIIKNWGGQFHFGLDSTNGRLSNYINLDGISGQPNVVSPGALPTGQWVHAAVTVNSATNEQKLYIDGLQVATAPFSGALTNSPCPGIAIGVKPSCNGTQASTNVPGFWHGRLDEVAVWDAALTPRQVFEIYRLGSAGLPILEENNPPVAVAGPDQAIRAGDTVNLNGSQSYDDNTDTANLQFSWAFQSVPAGSAAILANPDSSGPSFVADVQGEYQVSLIVTDSEGLSGQPDIVLVSSDNLAPTADAGPDQLVVTGSAVNLDGSLSADPENDPLAFSWSLVSAPAASTAFIVAPQTVAPSFVADQDGVFSISLEVSDFVGPGTPDLVIITAATPEDYAEIVTVEVAAEITELPSASVTTSGNQGALTNFLAQAVAASNSGDTEEAIQKLEKAITRVDGCFLRGQPDQNGPGRDWVTNCTEQVPIYESLSDALAALLSQ